MKYRLKYRTASTEYTYHKVWESKSGAYRARRKVMAQGEVIESWIERVGAETDRTEAPLPDGAGNG